MSFKKYSSLENTYREKSILKYLTTYPELNDIQWYVTEKLDGANISFIFSPHTTPVVCKRSGPLYPNESFFDIQNTMNKYLSELSVIQDYSNMHGKSFQIFGEIYGPGINDRIDYGTEKRIKFFDMLMDGKYLSKHEFEGMMSYMSIEHMMVPHIGIMSLSEALALDVENKGIEGIVIAPYKETFYMPNTDERIILKKKSEKFGEKENSKPSKKSEVSQELKDLATRFEDYITENRILGVFNKYGPISDKKEIGKYLGLIREDARQDFISDNPEMEIVDKDMKWMMSVAGAKSMRLLNKYL